MLGYRPAQPAAMRVSVIFGCFNRIATFEADVESLVVPMIPLALVTMSDASADRSIEASVEGGIRIQDAHAVGLLHRPITRRMHSNPCDAVGRMRRNRALVSEGEISSTCSAQPREAVEGALTRARVRMGTVGSGSGA